MAREVRWELAFLFLFEFSTPPHSPPDYSAMRLIFSRIVSFFERRTRGGKNLNSKCLFTCLAAASIVSISACEKTPRLKRRGVFFSRFVVG